MRARAIRWTSVLAACAALAGCAGMTQEECRVADWYQLGYRDGDIYGMRPRIDQYAHECKVADTSGPEKQYLAGWTDGYREYTKRVMGSDCCAP
jgi:hypothetical protein